MSWLDDNSRAIANWIWQELSRGNSSNAVYVARGGRIAQTECVELVGEFVMLMAGAQAVAFRQGCDRCEGS